MGSGYSINQKSCLVQFVLHPIFNQHNSFTHNLIISNSIKIVRAFKIRKPGKVAAIIYQMLQEFVECANC